jgi:hypothetical protein
MNYTAKTVSTETPVTQPETVTALLNIYDIRFETRIENGQLKLWGNDTFDVYNEENGVQETEPFLAALSYFLEDTFTITSVGFTGNRHEPDALRWEVDDETITFRRVTGTEKEMHRDDLLSDIPHEVTSAYLPITE